VSADELQQRYLGAVLNYVAGRIGRSDVAEAEDITAEVFAAAFASRHRCPVPDAAAPSTAAGDDDPARAWLFGIARRKIADSYRSRARRPQTTVPALSETHPAPEGQSPEPRFLADEAAQKLHAILSTLPDDQREALRLRYIDELSLGDIGRILGKSPNATGQLLHRARQSMRTRGADYFGTDPDTEEQK
jgi:RNA polymerase sigma-70 factor (ECF subfamily)